MPLAELLRSTFGFPAFRVNQEVVCRAATDGKDVLLVMPTGAGKSLCYQLPAIARGGTGLVVSPLIALMEDQGAKLKAAGLRVARIHSGLSRDESRQACRDYLDGKLQFLFIAPERMRVPGFPEMLARRKPSLIAIDEAHCISAWGHDFRPDYRMLGDHLPALRPAPIIALTATATPAVQSDIVTQLHLEQPALFIHGFRRENLAIEVVEMSRPRRVRFTVDFLAAKERRPAIVYAPSRRAAEELASELGRHFPAAAYHAGLEPSVRERVQRHFQSGKLEVVVATIAFGMGIDKADVRTVVHYALPASVEAYYQEIGRAGRDGLPSRTVLLYSFVDRKIHDTFLERDYPPTTDLNRIAATLSDEYLMPDFLSAKLRMDREVVEKALEKLASQGAAQFDINGNVRRSGNQRWQSGYEQQVDFRRSQIERMMHFAETQQCRMTALIRHFGDAADAHKPCGHCDFCAPENATALPFREPTHDEERHLRAILRALSGGVSRSTGKLHTDLALTPDRKLFDTWLDALARAGLITFANDTFTTPEGRVIAYKKASLTHEGTLVEKTGDTFLVHLRDSTPSPGKAASGAKSSQSSRPSKASIKAEREQTTAAYTPAQQALEARIREWRKAEAAKTGKPAFMVFGDSTLKALVIATPQTISELLTVSGFGPERADRYGTDLIALCRQMQSITVSEEQPSLVIRGVDIDKHVSVRRESKHLSPVQQTRQNFKIAAEDLKPISLSTASGRKRSKAYDESANRRLDFEDDLRIFADAQAVLLREAPSLLLAEAAIAEILRIRPKTLVELEQVETVRADLPHSFLQGLLAVCVAEYKPQMTRVKRPQVRPNAVDSVFVREPARPYVRQGTQPEEERPLTPTQQTLDIRLREWRKAESAKLGLPQFFVLSSSTLRDIVLLHPRTLPHLKTIKGLGTEKLDKFGSDILEVCNQP